MSARRSFTAWIDKDGRYTLCPTEGSVEQPRHKPCVATRSATPVVPMRNRPDSSRSDPQSQRYDASASSPSGVRRGGRKEGLTAEPCNAAFAQAMRYGPYARPAFQQPSSVGSANCQAGSQPGLPFRHLNQYSADGGSPASLGQAASITNVQWAVQGQHGAPPAASRPCWRTRANAAAVQLTHVLAATATGVYATAACHGDASPS